MKIGDLVQLRAGPLVRVAAIADDLVKLMWWEAAPKAGSKGCMREVILRDNLIPALLAS
jgi:hypothetical protein